MSHNRFVALWKNVLVVGMTFLGVMYLSSYTHSSVYGQSETKDQICHLDKSKDAKLVSTMVVTAKGQDPEPNQPSQQETDKHCERPNPDGTDPDVGGVDPEKIGCACMRKCENGKPTENYENGKRCKVHCKPDNCECPNPCKT